MPNTISSAAFNSRLHKFLFILTSVIIISCFLSNVAQAVTLSWSSKTQMPTDRGQLGLAAGNDGKIYAFGGKSLNFGDELTTVEAYDPASNTWSVKANMPTQ